MDYEKKYKEALERARQVHTTNVDENKKSTEYIFPELKESEDEKTKRILHSISSKISLHLRDIFTEEEFQCFDAWSNAMLEKQEEKQETQYYCDKEELMHCLGKMVAYWADRHGCSVYEENDLMDYINIRMDAVIHLFNPNVCLVDLSDCSDEYRNAYYDGYNKCNREWLKKRGEKKPTMKVKEAWKEMRCEVYAQASGNRHQPNCSDNRTKMFSLNDIDVIIECINEKTTTN